MGLLTLGRAQHDGEWYTVSSCPAAIKLHLGDHVRTIGKLGRRYKWKNSEWFEPDWTSAALTWNIKRAIPLLHLEKWGSLNAEWSPFGDLEDADFPTTCTCYRERLIMESKFLKDEKWPMYAYDRVARQCSSQQRQVIVNCQYEDNATTAGGTGFDVNETQSYNLGLFMGEAKPTPQGVGMRVLIFSSKWKMTLAGSGEQRCRSLYRLL